MTTTIPARRRYKPAPGLHHARRHPIGTWTEHAACQDKPTGLFFGGEGERQEARAERETAAKQVCAGCPVRARCLEYALTRPEKHGVWGGLGEDEREKRRRSWLRAGRPALAS